MLASPLITGPATPNTEAASATVTTAARYPVRPPHGNSWLTPWAHQLELQTIPGVGEKVAPVNQDLGPEWLARRNAGAHARRLVVQLEKLGHTVVLDPVA